MPSWDPQQYRRFEEERALPCRDLLHRLSALSPATIVDLGCGTGTSTRLLREQWSRARIVGVDNSVEMIATAKSSGVTAEWILEDLRSWTPDRAVDLVFSNAALQWVDGHDRLFPRLLRQVAPGGALAVQMPDNWTSPAYRCLREVSESPRWAHRWTSRSFSVAASPPEFYYDLLAPLSSQVEVWSTEYQHVLPDPAAIVEWMKGTGMRPYLDSLDSAADREAFSGEVVRCVAGAYRARADGQLLFSFRRFFLVARR